MRCAVASEPSRGDQATRHLAGRAVLSRHRQPVGAAAQHGGGRQAGADAQVRAEEALALIAREKVTVTGGVPAVALSLLEQADGHDLSSLELVTFGGAPSPRLCPRRIFERSLDAMPGQGWGMTETSATCTTHSGQDYLHRPASCGPALAGQPSEGHAGRHGAAAGHSRASYGPSVPIS